MTIQKKILGMLTALVLAVVLIYSGPAHATVVDENCNYLGQVGLVYGQPGLCNDNVRDVLVLRIARIIAIFLGLLGLIMVVLIMYGGYLWMTARGNEQQVDDAKHTIQSAVIGAIIILASWAFTGWIIYNVGRAVS